MRSANSRRGGIRPADSVEPAARRRGRHRQHQLPGQRRLRNLHSRPGQWNRFVATETDEEGRITAYTRDAKGRPLTITRGSGTPQAVTTTYTYHATLNAPATMVEPGLTTTYN